MSTVNSVNKMEAKQKSEPEFSPCDGYNRTCPGTFQENLEKCEHAKSSSIVYEWFVVIMLVTVAKTIDTALFE